MHARARYSLDGVLTVTPSRVDLHARGARAAIDRHARRRRALEQILIECAAIDDDGFDAVAGIDDFVAGRRPEARGRQLVEQRAAGEIEFVERVGRKHARAMDGLADARVFFEKDGLKSRSSEACAGIQARGPAADDDHVVHLRGILPAFARQLA